MTGEGVEKNTTFTQTTNSFTQKSVGRTTVIGFRNRNETSRGLYKVYVFLAITTVVANKEMTLINLYCFTSRILNTFIS